MKSTFAVLAAVGMALLILLLLTVPAHGQTPGITSPAPVYGPPAPEDLAPQPYRTDDGRAPYTAEQIAAADAKWKADTRSAWTKFWVGQGLSATDAGLTCWALAQRNPDGSRRFKEGNPLFGKNASCGTVIGIKAGIAVLQYFLIRHEIRENPRRASRNGNWMLVLQGAPVMWNIAQIIRK